MTTSITSIEQLFDKALDVPPAERIEWLDANCAGDEALQRRLERLLAADATNSDGMLDEPIISRASEEMPLRVGSFTPVRLIGEGGMGVVFEATQEGTGRSVALKLVRAGLASPKGARRFRQEGELLARLNHPGIAHVYDAGTARTEYARGASGDRLFIAIELIRGTSVLEYAARKNMRLRGRVEIMEQVAHAVQHAHQRRVLHRDLKPSNILVAENGQPKILDFGIGRLISPTSSGGPTMTGQILGTAQYMSPEQASGDIALVDTRTDVYALGIILYELLAGRPAHDLGGLSAVAAARRVTDEEPRRLAAVAPETRGDLDAIVHKAIDHDPEARYESADALASDLRRYLNDEPIEARLPTTIEAAWKYARRHRTIVGGVVATTIALILGVIGTSLYGFRAAEQHRIAVWESYRLAMQASASAIALGNFDEARGALDEAPLKHRGWEHAHIRSRLDQWLISFDGPARGRPCAAADETRVLSALEDGRVGVWDIASGESINTFDLGIKVNSLARAAPGGVAAAAARDGGILLFSAESGEMIRLLAGEGDAPFIDVQFDTSGEFILGWNADEAVVVRTDGSGVALRIAADSMRHGRGTGPAALNGQGTRVALSMSGHTYVYDLRSKERLFETRIQPTPRTMSIAPGGAILTGDAQRTVRVLSDTLQELAVLMGHRSRLIADMACTDDDLAISVDAQFPGENWNPASRTIRLWNPLEGRQIGVLAMPPGSDAVRILPLDNARFITGGASDTPMLLWAHDRQEKTLLGRHTTYAYGVAWSPDGKLVASFPSATGAVDPFVRVWDVELRLEVARLPTRGNTFSTLVFSQDSTRLFFDAAGGAEARIESWDTESWKRIADDLTEPELISSMGGKSGLRLHRRDCFSPDGSIRAAAPNTLRDPPHGYLMVNGRRRELPDLPPNPRFAFTPDGTTLAVASTTDEVVRLISTVSFEETRRVDVGLRALALDFSPDGTRLAVVGFDSVIRLIDTQWWEPVADLRGHTATIHDVQFSPDGRSLATVSSDRTVRIWTTAPAPAGPIRD